MRITDQEQSPPGPTAALHQFVTLLDGMPDFRRIEAAETFLLVCGEITGRKSRDAFTALELAARVTVKGFSGSEPQSGVC